MKNQPFDQTRWNNNIAVAMSRARNGASHVAYVRFTADVENDRTLGIIKNHGWTSDLETPVWKALYKRSELAVMIDYSPQHGHSMTILNNTGFSVEQISAEFNKLDLEYMGIPAVRQAIAATKKPTKISDLPMGTPTGRIVAEHIPTTWQLPVVEAKPKEELWWQKEKRLAAEKLEQIVALRKSVRSLLGM